MRRRILSAILVVALLLGCYFTAVPKQAQPFSYEPTESVFLKNDRGTYTFVEINAPKGEGPFPLVFMSHGFAGTIHSGGAMELGQRLADAGILAVRCDFNPFIEPNSHASRTDEYPLRNMARDAILSIRYAIDNYPVDEHRIGIYGRSQGGRLTMFLGNESYGGYDYRAMALIAPAGDEICFKRFLSNDVKSYEDLKTEALGETGYAVFKGVHVTPEWFYDTESYIPSKEGAGFNDKPVLLYYNTKDTIIYPDTALRCAAAYENCEVVEVTTEDGHGFEMGQANSALKENIMEHIVSFFKENL